MPINHKHKCIFVHIPKTGGSSMECVLGMLPPNELYGFEDYNGTKFDNSVGIQMASKGAKLKCLQHLGAHQIMERYSLDIWGSYFKFAFVRNPFDLVVSNYNYVLQKRKDLHKRYSLTENMSFEDFLKSDIYKIKQKNYVCNKNGEIILDFIGRYENIVDDFRYVCKKIDLGFQLPKINESKRKDYREYYSKETKEIVEKTYKDDIELFKYEF